KECGNVILPIWTLYRFFYCICKVPIGECVRNAIPALLSYFCFSTSFRQLTWFSERRRKEVKLTSDCDGHSYMLSKDPFAERIPPPSENMMGKTQQLL
ncbi:hypothetical protein STEG23_038295, partial [Scotinomys teguina]